jgi:hypothetical protein
MTDPDQGRRRGDMQTTRRSGREDAEAVLRAELGLARVAVDGFAQGATAYWLM